MLIMPQMPMFMIKDKYVGSASGKGGFCLVIGKTFIQRNADADAAENCEIAEYPAVAVFADDGDTLAGKVHLHHVIQMAGTIPCILCSSQATTF